MIADCTAGACDGWRSTDSHERKERLCVEMIKVSQYSGRTKSVSDQAKDEKRSKTFNTTIIPVNMERIFSHQQIATYGFPERQPSLS
jgi:hypothetical protein